MAIQKCHECGHEVSTEADACPHCGAPPRKASSGGTSTTKETKIAAWIGLGLIVFALIKCSSSTVTATSDQEAAAPEPITSCEWGEMPKADVVVFDNSAESHICKTLQNHLGHVPSTQLLRTLLQGVAISQSSGCKDDPKDIAYQMVGIAEARGNNDDASISNTFNIVTKIAQGWQCRVTAKDINVMLRTSGERAKQLNDDGLESMAAVILEDKKAHGE